MTRFLLILALVGYVLYKVGGFFFKVGAASQQPRQPRPQGNVHVDSAPKKEKDGHIKGGDYIDYEEVK
jgi:hypothetical protein